MITPPNVDIKPEKPRSGKEEVVVIGGGLGGCLTALMLAKNPRYHVTLIEEQDKLLNGASTIASRLHLGGEYPLNEKTAQDCLMGAIIWKLLMPKTIYSAAPPMKFFVSAETEEEWKKAQNKNGVLDPLQYYLKYEAIRTAYKHICEQVMQALHWTREETEKELFGSPDSREFFRTFDAKELKRFKKYYGNVGGGFQTQEIGLNVPKYLYMIEKELEAAQAAGHITILKNHKVRAGKPENSGTVNNNKKEPIFEGIEENKKDDRGGYFINFEVGKPIYADQVVNAAWQRGPEITPGFNSKVSSQEEKPEDGQKGMPAKAVTVYKRAMLLIDLPEGWQTPPAFIMLGEHGGMLSPYNDKIAVCYIPTDACAYRGKSAMLTADKPRLPPDWDKEKNWRPLTVPQELELDKQLNSTDKHVQEQAVEEKAFNESMVKWKNEYFKALQKRFPVLEKMTVQQANPRLIIRDTLNFEQTVEKRPHMPAREHFNISTPISHISNMGMHMDVLQEQQMKLWARPTILEVKRGLFTLCPTKATYAVEGALQVAAMVNERSLNKNATLIAPPNNVLNLILSPENRKKYSLLKTMREREEKAPLEVPQSFFDAHTELSPLMLANSWSQKNTWAAELDRKSEINRGRA